MSSFADLAGMNLTGGDSATFLVRWRRRQEGPYPASLIEAKLAANEIGLLHEIFHKGQWVTIQNFIAEQEAALQAQGQAQEEQEQGTGEEVERENPECTLVSELETMNRKRLNGLQLAHFQHPTDAAVQDVLMQNVRALKPEAHSIIAEYEAYLYARHISSSLLVNDEQLPELHMVLVEACEILDVPPPLLFVENNSAINAWTSGSKVTFVVLTSALVEKLNHDEVLAVIGHELGHIKGHHVYYRALAENAQSILAVQSGQAAELAAAGDWLSYAVGMVHGASVSNAAAILASSLFEWSRVAEFTADRASLLVTQDLDITMNVMAKLASGLNRHFNQQAFMKQAEYFRTFGAASGDYYRRMVIDQDTHPLVVLRAEELRNWATSDGYRDLANPQQASAEIRFFCGGCSQQIVAPILLSGHAVQCPTCGRAITVPGVTAPPIIT